jgi:tetratricopeptide (TPR) repeat protein
MKSKILNLAPCVVACLVAALMAFGFIAGDKVMPITTKSDKAKALFQKARSVIFENGDTKKATELLKQALELDGDFALANLYYGFMGFGSIEKEKYLNAAYEQKDRVSEAEQHFIQAYIDFEYSRRDEGISELKTAISLAPDDNMLLLHLADVYVGYEKYDDALELAKRSSELDPDFAGALNYQGFVLWNMKKYDEAEKFYLQSLEMSPDNTQFLNRYGQLLRAVGRIDEAIKMHTKALSIKEDYLSALFLGHCYVANNNFSAARDNYLKAMDFSSNNGQKNFCLYSVGTTWLYDGNLPEALSAFDRRIEFNKKLGGMDEYIMESTIIKAYSCLLYNDFENSGKFVEDYKGYLSSLRLSEADMTSFTQYTNLLEGYHYAYSGNTEMAEKHLDLYEKSLSEAQKDTFSKDLYEMKGIIAFNKGNYKEAIVNFELGEGAMALYYAGLAYEKLGDVNKAKETYEKISNNKLTSFDLAAAKPFARKRLAIL